MGQNLQVLAVDDQDDSLFVLERLLKEAGFSVLSASSGKDALKLLENERPDLILLDVMMPGMDGFEVTKQIKSHAQLKYIPLVLLTANDSVEDVVRGLNAGADDYLKKPYIPEELLARLQAVLRTRRLYQALERSEKDNTELRRQLGKEISFDQLIGKSAAMADVFSLLNKISDSQVSVLIQGESGTGKELVARAIHANSTRVNQAFVVLNCSAFNDNLLESELFGHVRGAFTGAIRNKQGLFEVADGGTLFLDELGEMSLSMQAKLLRVLQDGTFMPVGGTQEQKTNVRIIAATNRDLDKMIAAETFREDLFYRISVLNIKLPSLRERKTDLAVLSEHILTKICKRDGKPIKVLNPEALKVLIDYDWPGNIRQLENELERLVLLSGKAQEITVDLISPQITSPRMSTQVIQGSARGKLKDSLEALEREMISTTLQRLNGNKSEAARELGISRSNLIDKVKGYDLE